MKKYIQIRTEVLELRKDEMQIRTVVIVIREGGPRSSHAEVKWMQHFRDWPATSEAVHNRLTTSMWQWVETGVKDRNLLEYGLE